MFLSTFFIKKAPNALFMGISAINEKRIKKAKKSVDKIILLLYNNSCVVKETKKIKQRGVAQLG